MSKRKKYSHNEKKAYYIGYGMGFCCDQPNDNIIDARMGLGQHPSLCLSAYQGFKKGKQNRHVPMFEKGYKKYPISRRDYLKK